MNNKYVGRRIELVFMDDAQAPPVGTQGTITHIDDIENIHVKWDNGSTLALVKDSSDRYKFIDKEWEYTPPK